MFKVLLLIVVVLMHNVFVRGPSKTAVAAPRGLVYQCPHGWVTYEGSPSCYRVPPHPTNSWHEARKTCLSMGSDLVKISSAQENNYVAMLLLTYFPVAKPLSFAWIGFLADSKRRFSWVDGTPLTGQYLNWGRGEPNDSGQKEDCGSMFLPKEARARMWNDLPCLWNSKLGYVCEKERPKRVMRGY